MKAPLAILLWLFSSVVLAAPQASSSPNEVRKQWRITLPFWVFRGEWRSPTTLKAQGGFIPYSISPPTEKGYGLLNHQQNKVLDAQGHKDTVYVSTSALFDAAAKFACTMSNGGYLLGGRNRFVYLIHASPNMISMTESLLQFDDFPGEEEFTAMGGILWEQVYGWVRLPDTYRAIDPEKTRHGHSSFYDMVRGHFSFNPDYNSNKFKDQPASGGQFRLAGVPKSEWPWSHYQQKSMRDAALDFMDQVGWVVDWQGDFPLIAPRPGVTSSENADDPSTWLDK
ncbi:putative enterotoxin [Ophiocordyceps australis]|uniref:Putative enterotoxin n=1 Tax=Ophiocordyceps australis TaxID=1399860 RepID=A0A2C5YF85_9HYPO|nr:putative enterotoxin [Ophiocordyceps australis]